VKWSDLRDLAALAVIGSGVWLIVHEREGLNGRFLNAQSQSDAYLLPAVEQTYVASLGYRSALADQIFGHVLVSYGLHFQEKRLFEFVGDYLDVINRLDPKFRDPYRFADTLLTLQPVAPPLESYRRARLIQERGLKELPNDQELWATTGQFVAYLATSQLTDAREIAEYRAAGARYLMRACDLVGSNDAIPYHCVTAAALLDRTGNQAAIRQFLERVLSAVDDPAIQELASGYLKRVVGQQAQEEAAARQARFRKKWQTDLPFSSKVEIDALGPAFDPAACARRDSAGSADCASSWKSWAKSSDAAEVR
jgi:hypothetical protein